MTDTSGYGYSISGWTFTSMQEQIEKCLYLVYREVDKPEYDDGAWAGAEVEGRRARKAPIRFDDLEANAVYARDLREAAHSLKCGEETRFSVTYGEFTQGSMTRVAIEVRTQYGLHAILPISEANFLDIGCGLCLPVFHFKIMCGIKNCDGIEVKRVTFDLAVKLRRNIEEEMTKLGMDEVSIPRTNSVQIFWGQMERSVTCDILAYDIVYMFDFAFFSGRGGERGRTADGKSAGRFWEWVAAKLNESPRIVILVSYIAPSVWWLAGLDENKFKCVSQVHNLQIRKGDSRRKHTAFIFARINRTQCETIKELDEVWPLVVLADNDSEAYQLRLHLAQIRLDAATANLTNQQAAQTSVCAQIRDRSLAGRVSRDDERIMNAARDEVGRAQAEVEAAKMTLQAVKEFVTKILPDQASGVDAEQQSQPHTGAESPPRHGPHGGPAQGDDGIIGDETVQQPMAQQPAALEPGAAQVNMLRSIDQEHDSRAHGDVSNAADNARGNVEQLPPQQASAGLVERECSSDPQIQNGGIGTRVAIALMVLDVAREAEDAGAGVVGGGARAEGHAPGAGAGADVLSVRVDKTSKVRKSTEVPPMAISARVITFIEATRMLTDTTRISTSTWDRFGKDILKTPSQFSMTRCSCHPTAISLRTAPCLPTLGLI
ncbi:hypothetical protein CYMTET_17717 [Cymbomonas tetramitiformis]|uniref:Uncharacterized protein n=1 Tax=Cymbomonas tetramitiformis TaxID=36881 RepID=A0AAE0GA05_9CHLO|nr:hypothetical protein CYMTET_17717 [Cymbomonas tetramitiformis]